MTRSPTTIVVALGTTQIFLGTTPLRCVQYSNANRIDGLAPPGMGTQAVIADDSIAGSVPTATVPFQYLQDGGIGPVDAGPTADDAGCPRGP